MDLKEFIEEKLECEIDLSYDDFLDFLHSSGVDVFDEGEITEELCIDNEIEDSIMEFIDIQKFAEYKNYTCVNEDCYVENIGLDYFICSYNNEYGKNIEDMINEWRD